MAGHPKHSEEHREQYRKDKEKEQLANVVANLKDAVEAANKIPLRNKTQYMFYPEIRTLEILKAIAKSEQTSVQDLIRTQMDAYIERRLKPPRKRATKKGA